jgi:hypothetical protein
MGGGGVSDRLFLWGQCSFTEYSQGVKYLSILIS